MQVTAVLTPEDDGYVAYNPETGIASQGDTIEEALTNLREAVELYLEDQPLPSGRPPIVTSITVDVHA
ncbi:type II toxin-antitoxin system HicB family antitoxin [uncultured Sphingomonas sp.]|uniref:type II toxin-antitoxin system HicB family antitoxin n=1 Tax=uncultured Sphingomonas sp. TaxID=158754 RepID=UPI0035CB2B3D